MATNTLSSAPLFEVGTTATASFPGRTVLPPSGVPASFFRRASPGHPVGAHALDEARPRPLQGRGDFRTEAAEGGFVWREAYGAIVVVVVVLVAIFA